MSLRNFDVPKLVASPRGAWQSVTNRRTGTPSRASFMQNMRIRFGTARSRAGTSAVFPSTGKVTGLFNWITPFNQNLVLYQDGAAIKSYNQQTAVSATLSTGITTSRAPSFAPLDVWTYYCGYNTLGAGAFQCEIFDGTNVDKAFRAPPTIPAWRASDGGPGYCTKGQHFIGFVYQNRTGYSGIPVTNLGTFPITATTNASPDVLTIPGHTLVNGQYVSIAGSTGDLAINGSFIVVNVSGSTFQLTDLNNIPVNGSGPYTGGAVLTSPFEFTTQAGLRQINISVSLPSQPDAGVSANGGIQATLFLIATRADNPALWYFIPTDAQTGQIGQQSVPLNTGPFAITATTNGHPDVLTIPGHTLTNEQRVTITGSTGDTAINGSFIVVNVSGNTFQLTDLNNALINGNGVYTGGATLTLAFDFVFSMSDEDIASSLAGDTAQANFLLLAQDAGGNGPFNPSFVVAYGQRMCYGAGTTLYASDINNPQQIAADINAVRMQNQRLIGMAFQLPGNSALYLTGDHWTGYVTDNNDSPATWGVPIGVSDALGAIFPNCVCAATGGNYVWIVTESGPYYFDGAYTSNQLLYLISGLDELERPIGWNRVNWAAAYAIQIKDDVANLKLYIAVPLDGSTECNYMFVIDYRMGKTFETVDIGIDKFTPQLFGSIGVVKDYGTGRSELWIGPNAAGSVAKLDHSTHNDLGSAIQCIWESGLVRGQEITTSMIRVGYLDIWARGNAPLDPVTKQSTLGLAIISMDTQLVITPDLQGNMGVPTALVESPGIMYSAKFDMTHISNFTVAFQTDAVDEWFELSSFTAYMKADLSNR